MRGHLLLVLAVARGASFGLDDLPQPDAAEVIAELLKGADPAMSELLQTADGLRDLGLSSIRQLDAEEHGNSTQGWNILGKKYLKPCLLDGLSLEWQYFMVHAEPIFTGIVAVVLADPRGHLPRLLPSGGNLAIAGKFGTGPCGALGTHCINDFVTLGLDFQATGYPDTLSFASERTVDGQTDFATLEVTAGGAVSSGTPTLRFRASTPNAAWDLYIEQDWDERAPFPVTTGRDLAIPGEHWTVNMVWPRTKISGTMLNKATGEEGVLTHDNAHGYRENSFGRWLFALGGWDFAIFSSQESGVMWAWQSYHPGEQLDQLDVSFRDPADGAIRNIHFASSLGELGWYHDEWVFRHDARQCAPSDAVVEAANGEYYIRATILIGDSQVPLLSTATPATKIYVINEWMPTLEGTIYRQGSGEVVATFSGIAGGEISFLRSLLPYRTPAHCKWWGKPTYMMPLTHKVEVPGVKRDACAQLNNGHPVVDFLRCSLNLYRGCLWAAERRRCY